MPSSPSKLFLFLCGFLAFGHIAATSSCPAPTEKEKVDINKLPAVIAAPIYFQYATELREQAQSFRNPKAKDAALRVAFKRYAELANVHDETDSHSYVWPAQAQKMECYCQGEGIEQDYATALALAFRLREQSEDLSSKRLGQFRVGLFRCCDAYSLTSNSISCRGYSDLTTAASQTDNMRAQQLAFAYISSFKLLKQLFGDERMPVIETAANSRKIIFPNSGKDLYKITLPPDGQIILPEAKMLLDYIQLIDRAATCDSINEYNALFAGTRKLGTMQVPKQAKTLGLLLATIVERIAGKWLIHQGDADLTEVANLLHVINPKFDSLIDERDMPIIGALGIVSKFLTLRDFGSVSSMLTFVRLVHQEEDAIFVPLVGKRFVMIETLPAIAYELNRVSEYIAALCSIHHKIFQPNLNVNNKILFYFLALRFADVARETDDKDYYVMSIIALNDYLASEGLAEFWANEPAENATTMIQQFAHDFPNVSMEGVTRVADAIARIRDHFQTLRPYVADLEEKDETPRSLE